MGGRTSDSRQGTGRARGRGERGSCRAGVGVEMMTGRFLGLGFPRPDRVQPAVP
jgi:hypothetical protein